MAVIQHVGAGATCIRREHDAVLVAVLSAVALAEFQIELREWTCNEDNAWGFASWPNEPGSHPVDSFAIRKRFLAAGLARLDQRALVMVVHPNFPTLALRTLIKTASHRFCLYVVFGDGDEHAHQVHRFAHTITSTFNPWCALKWRSLNVFCSVLPAVQAAVVSTCCAEPPPFWYVICVQTTYDACHADTQCQIRNTIATLRAEQFTHHNLVFG